MSFRKFAAAVLAGALCLSMCLPSAFAAQRAQLGLKVKVEATGMSVFIPAEELTLVLEGKTGAEPMPEGTAEGQPATLKVSTAKNGGTVEATFPDITFTKPDKYYYTLSQKAGSSRYGTYDETVYNIEVMAYYPSDDAEEMKVVFNITEKGGDSQEKAEELVFTNKYSYTPDPGPMPDPGPDPEPQPDPDPTPDPTPETPVTPEPTPEEQPASSVVLPEPEPETPEESKPAEKLIQTGQTNWPIPVMIGVGGALICAGIFLGKKKDDDAE